MTMQHCRARWGVESDRVASPFIRTSWYMGNKRLRTEAASEQSRMEELGCGWPVDKYTMSHRVNF